MPLKTFKPLTPSQRYKELPSFEEITKSKPEKSLLTPLKRSGGRNNTGRITTRHIGGGHKRHYRLVDFKRNKRENVAPKVGNAMPLGKVPLGTEVHNIELLPGGGGKVARSAGQSAVLSNRDGGWALLKMRSGEIRRFHEACYCTIGAVGNRDHMNEVSGKAGRSRWQGIRPTVRGMCMNPVDHPNGGGEGKSKSGGGRQHLLSPWGHAKGQKTRKKKKTTSVFIVESRHDNKKKK